MNALKAVLIVAAFGCLSVLVDAAMTGAAIYLTVMALGLAGIAVLTVGPQWKR